MEKNKSVFQVTLVVILFCCLLIAGCKKDIDPVKEPLSDDGATLKKMFEEKNYYSFLTEPFNDTSQIRWIPSWMDGAMTVPNDTTKFVHIVLTPQLENTVTGKVVPSVRFWGYTKRIIIKLTGTYTFYLGTYHSSQINQSLTIPMDFTGIMRMEDLASGKSFIYNYVNGSVVK